MTTISKNAIQVALELIVSGRPGGHEILRAYQMADYSFLRKEVRTMLPKVISEFSGVFPTTGIIDRDSGGYYIKIDDGNSYTRFASEVLIYSEIEPDYDNLIIQLPDYKRGTHIQLGDNPSRLGRTIKFDVISDEPLTAYRDDRVIHNFAPIMTLAVAVRLPNDIRISEAPVIDLAVIGQTSSSNR